MSVKKPQYVVWLVAVLFIYAIVRILSASEELMPLINDVEQAVSQEPKKETSANIISKDDIAEDVQAGKFIRDFEWNYGKNTYHISLNLYPEIYNEFKKRERTRDYDLFASDVYSKEYIKSITDALEKLGKDTGLSNEEIPYFIISFVQNLPYTSDDVTTGFDEYPRFPYETFYDNGGDCEDTSILASAMLHELGYGVALLQFPGHMAVGVKCSPSTRQTYYTHLGTDYCYLETTGRNWDVGDVPPNVDSAKAKVRPIVERPALETTFNSKYTYDQRDVYVDVDVSVRNLGSEPSENTKIYVSLQTKDTSKVWDYIESEGLEVEPESTYEYTVTNLHSNTKDPFRIYVIAYGDNVIADEAYSDWIYLS